jgi:hypothetical protein
MQAAYLKKEEMVSDTIAPLRPLAAGLRTLAWAPSTRSRQKISDHWCLTPIRSNYAASRFVM